MIEIGYKEKDFDYELKALVAGFFPKQRIVEVGAPVAVSGEEVLHIYFTFEQKWFGIRIWKGSGPEEVLERKQPVSGEEDFRKHQKKTSHPYRLYYKNQVKFLLYQMLLSLPEEMLTEKWEKRIPAWGTMTGVRPTKIPMQEFLSGKTETQVRLKLKELYGCSEEKSRLCIGIARREAELLKQVDYEDGYSLYIGIPFCPTTCLYCSFPSYPMQRFGHLTKDYLNALEKEIQAVSEKCKGRKLTSVYIGGGTPTALEAGPLDQLLSFVEEHFPASKSVEFTVEAGRPDSITREKLMVLKKHGICRISVNPQTMQQKTLDLIGRRHTVEDTERAFLLAREIGFSNINMDLIAGLPGESMEDFKNTLAQIEALAPDSITVHSLVIKRASKLREVLEEESGGQECVLLTEEERMVLMGQMLKAAVQELQEKGYLPYYMYRQKNSAGHFGSDGQENIGFAKEGKECLYNILIMEEMQTIVALGAGASTKLYHEESVEYHGKQIRNGLVSRIENVKSVPDYIERIDEMLERKESLFGTDSLRVTGMNGKERVECNGGDF